MVSSHTRRMNAKRTDPTFVAEDRRQPAWREIGVLYLCDRQRSFPVAIILVFVLAVLVVFVIVAVTLAARFDYLPHGHWGAHA